MIVALAPSPATTSERVKDDCAFSPDVSVASSIGDATLAPGAMRSTTPSRSSAALSATMASSVRGASAASVSASPRASASRSD
jgi:hypothetical protein